MQRYHCAGCGKSCDGKIRVSAETLLTEYLQGKQTYRQLAQRHGCSLNTVRRRLAQVAPPKGHGELPSSAVVVMDTTYFGRGYGLLVLKDAATKANLYVDIVKKETIAAYREGVAELERCNCRVLVIVCDGRKGLFEAFADRPVQMCQYHQIAIVGRYLTRHPKLPAAKELWRLTSSLCDRKEEDFAAALTAWHAKWKTFLDERTVSDAHSRYAHPRLRSAYLSLVRHLPVLFTCLRYPMLPIPNTTNAADGHFSELKKNLRNHNGLSRKHRQRLILQMLKPACVNRFLLQPNDGLPNESSGMP